MDESSQNKGASEGPAKLVSVRSKRAPNAFALYIKENFGSVEGLASARMKKLGEMWNAAKKSREMNAQ